MSAKSGEIVIVIFLEIDNRQDSRTNIFLFNNIDTFLRVLNYKISTFTF